MLPKVVLYDAVSLDGRTEGFAPDVGRVYTQARWGEDVLVAGADTMLAGGDSVPVDDPTAPVPAPTGGAGPLMAIVDSRGRVRNWDAWRTTEYWRDAVALVSEATPSEYRAHLEARGVRAFLAGSDRVDLRAALEWLAAEHSARVVRVESGGSLNGALLRAGLVDEAALLVHPVIVGEGARSFVQGDLPAGMRLELTETETLDGGLLWLRYKVVHTAG